MQSREQRRVQILQAAGAEFKAHGFAGSSMQGIAKAAGISRASLYTYFGGKEEVFHAVVKLFEWNIARQAQRAVEELGPGAPLVARLTAAFGTRQATWLSATNTQTSYTYELLQLRAEHAAGSEKTLFESYIVTMIEESTALGEFVPKAGCPPADDLANLLVQCTSGIALFEGDVSKDKRNTLRLLIQTVISGLED